MYAFFISITAMVIALFGHIVAFRLSGRTLFSYAVSLITGTSVVISAVFLCESQPDRISTCLVAFLLYCSWWFVFLNFVQSAQSSLRVNVIRSIMTRGGRLDRKVLFVEYNNANLIERRLDRLLQSGVIRMEGGRYFVESFPARCLARFFYGMKMLVMGHSSEFKQNR